MSKWVPVYSQIEVQRPTRSYLSCAVFLVTFVSPYMYLSEERLVTLSLYLESLESKGMEILVKTELTYGNRYSLVIRHSLVLGSALLSRDMPSLKNYIVFFKSHLYQVKHGDLRATEQNPKISVLGSLVLHSREARALPLSRCCLWISTSRTVCQQPQLPQALPPVDKLGQAHDASCSGL